MNKNGTKEKDLVLSLFGAHKGIFIAIIIAWLVFFISVTLISNDLSFKWPPSMSLDSLNSFGGIFNVLTSLFTGLAFAGLIISVILQTQELKATREEFSGQKKALQNQEFDNKFFQMLNLLNTIKSNLTLEKHNGDEVFERLLFELLIEIKKQASVDLDETDKLNIFIKIFDEYNDTYDTNFKYYFLNLYQIFKYISESAPKEKTKFYSNIIRAQLSKNELILLTYNAIGVQNFTTNTYQQYIESYSLLEHMQLDDFLSHPHVRVSDISSTVEEILKKYNDDAFGENQKFIDDLENLRIEPSEV